MTVSSFRDRDVEVWRAWNQHQSTETTSGLLNQVGGLIDNVVKPIKRRGVTGGSARVPPQVVDGKARMITLDLLRTFNPDAGPLGPYLSSHLPPKLQSELNKYRNLVRIPFGKAEHIGKVKEVERDLVAELGRVPSDEEVAAKVHLPLKTVSSVRHQSSQADYLSSGAEVETVKKDDPYTRASRQTYIELSTQDRALFDLWMKQDKSGTEILNMLNMSRRQLQEAQARIRSKMNENLSYMG